MDTPPTGDDWIALSNDVLEVGAVHDWAVVPHCGGIAVFTGTVRDHAEGREGVDHLTYEAYSEPAVERMTEVAAEIRRRWPGTGRVALLHRVGRLELRDVAVVVAVSAPHRAEAFEACRFGIDVLKATVPIWKHEAWRDGSGWGSDARAIESVGDVAGRPT